MKYLFYILVVCTHCEKLFSQEGIMNQGEMISKNVLLEIPFVNTRDEIIQHVDLKGISFTFIFDTGAPFSISQEIQNSHQYSILRKVTLKDANNKTDTIYIVIVDTLRIGNINFIHIPALVLDFKNSPIGCQNISGIVGSNIARFLMVQFDLINHKIILTDQPNKINPAEIKMPQPIFLDKQSNAYLHVGLTDSLMDTVHFDSGMGKLYDMNIIKAQQFISVVNKEPITIKKGFGVTGQGILGNAKEENAYLIHTNIHVGRDKIEGVDIGSTHAASRIGRELLNYGTLTIDYINSQYYFNPYPQRLHKPRPNFGFNIITEQNKVIAGVVWENTDAHKKGLQSGNEILRINDKSFRNKSACDIEKLLLKEFNKKKWKVTFLKDGMKNKIQLSHI